MVSQETITKDTRAKMIIFGDQGCGKTELVNSIRMRGPMKLSGAENVAGYCFYNERVTFHCSHNQSDDDETADVFFNTRLAITEVR